MCMQRLLCLPAFPSQGQHHPRLFTSCCQDAKGGLISHPKPGKLCCPACTGPGSSSCPGGQAQQHLEATYRRSPGQRVEVLPPQFNTTSCFLSVHTRIHLDLDRAPESTSTVTFFAKLLPGLKKPVCTLSSSLLAPTDPDGQQHLQRHHTASGPCPEWR